MQTVRNFRITYAGLLITRFCFAIFGTGYIHPDEYFQNGEVTAGRIFGYNVLRTWEWDQGFPVRSILPPFLTTGLPFLFAKLTFTEPSLGPSLIFRLERLIFCGISLLLDYSVFFLVRNPESRRHALLLLASSHVMHTFQSRPFSNSIEAILVALCFVNFRNIVEASRVKKRSNMHLHTLAVLLVIGTFTRVTFIAFALPMGWQLLRLVFQPTSMQPRNPPWNSQARVLLPPALTAALTSLAIILIDTYYFRGDFWNPTITPLNFLSYNLSPKNLAEHGIHPRWLHLFVNLPMMVGPPVLWLAVLAGIQYWRAPAKRKADVNRVIDGTVIYTFFVAIAILSIQPHQEPRFLSPFLVLFVVFVANTGKLLRTGRVFWATWVTSNILLTLLFGVLHQGGVLSSLFYLHNRISAAGSAENTQIIYWKTYMPPRHLLAIKERDVISGRINMTDLAGSSSTLLYESLVYPSNARTLSSDMVDGSSYYSKTTTYLVTPFPMKASLPREITRCFHLNHRAFPHLDLDHIGESMEEGWRDGLSLGVWTVNQNCVSTNWELD